jgi:hypothetical protein
MQPLRNKSMDFFCDYKYKDRESKSQFVYEKYKSILINSVLDIGADQCYLRKYLPVEVKYTGIGLGDSPDLIKINLEKQPISLPDNSFHTVICLDVLEHLENIHEIFDELCRVSSRYVIISLPNPWCDFMHCLQFKKYNEAQNMKFYGLPKEKPIDRHKWFYPPSEAREFIEYKSLRNKMKIIDLFIENHENPGIHKKAENFFRKDMNFSDLHQGTHWWVLEKTTGDHI